jgi:peptide/nickel transport system substrate-binding protein
VHKPAESGSTIRGFALFSKLWEWSENMTPRLALAEEAEPNADASEWVIRLRKGLEFHNGKTITADDLIFSILRLSDPELASPHAAHVALVDRKRLTKLDERTVRIYMKPGHGFVPLPDTWVNFGGIVPPDYHPITNPVGAGPYKFKEFIPGQRALFTRFENFYKTGKPYADELEIIEFRDHTTRLAALEAGQLDMINAIPPELKALVENNPRIKLLRSETHGFQSFNLNLATPPFDDERVRRAFRLLVDRRELVQRVLNGEGRIANDLYAPHDPSFNHDIPQREHNLQEAKALLKSAGQEHLSLELATLQAGANAALVFAEQAKRAGVDVQVKKYDAGTFNGPSRAKWAMSTGSGLGQSFLCSGSSQDSPVAITNRTNFRDPRFGELFLAALKEPNLERRTPLIREAQQIQHERGGLLVWAFVNVLDAYAPNIGGLKPEDSHFSTWRFENIWRRAERA